MRHTIVTMTRGDAHKIAEWLDYHARLGFDDVQVVLDGDVDGTEELLRSLDVPAEVTVHPRAEVGEYFHDLTPEERRGRVLRWREEHAADLAAGRMKGIDPLAWRQHLHFGPILAPYAAGQRGKGWLGLIDVDEFVVLGRHATIGELMAEQVATVGVPRVRFLNFNVDTAGHDPSRPVLAQHSRRWSHADLLTADARWAKRVKSLVRYRVAVLNATVHKINRGEHVVLDPEVARLHHFKVPASSELGIPFTVDDPIAGPPGP